jgi:hypothetical protein
MESVLVTRLCGWLIWCDMPHVLNEQALKQPWNSMPDDGGDTNKADAATAGFSPGGSCVQGKHITATVLASTCMPGWCFLIAP